MSGTLINSRQEEIIHKLQKKWIAKQTIFSGIKKKKYNRMKCARDSHHHLNLVPSNYK